MIAPAGRVEPLDHRSRRGDKVEIAVDRIIRMDAIIGRREQQYLVTGDFHLLLGDRFIGGSRHGTLPREVGVQTEAVAGLKQHPNGGPFAEERIVGHERHIGDDGGPQQRREHGFVERQLLFEPCVEAVIHASRGGQVP